MKTEDLSQTQRGTVARQKKAVSRKRKSINGKDSEGGLSSGLRSAWQLLLRAARPFKIRIASPRLQALETLSLGNKRTISLLRVDGQELVVGATPNSVVLLSRLERSRGKMTLVPNVEDLVAKFNSNVQ